MSKTAEPEMDISVEDLRSLARYYIQIYFHDKTDSKGQPFSQDMLINERNINMVLNNDINNGVDKIYKVLNKQYTPEELHQFMKRAKLPGDVRWVIHQFKDCSRRCIPKHFAAGITLMYLELCKGYDLSAV